MPGDPKVTKLLAPFLACACLGAASSAQLSLCHEDGVLGSAITYTLEGAPGSVWVLLPSTNAGPTPLLLIDPSDPRLLDVGLDLIGLAKSGILGGAPLQVSYPVPNSISLHGLPIFAQAISLPGAGTLVDKISEQSLFSLSSSRSVLETFAPMVASRRGHTATALLDGRVLITGGDVPDANEDPVSTLASMELHNYPTDTFSATASPMSTQRGAHTATLLADGRVLLLGGYSNHASGQSLRSGEIFDPATGTTTLTAPMLERRTQHSATLLADGRVLVIGGAELFDLGQVFSSLATTHATTEVYDPVADSWSAGPILDEPRFAHGTSLLADGRVLITAGVEVLSLFGISTPLFTNKVQAYNPATNALQNLSPLPDAVGFAYHAQLTLSNGRVLVAGGADGNLVTLSFAMRDECYRYDPNTDAWTVVGALNFERAYGQLLETPDGKVISIGGLSSVDVVTTHGVAVREIEQSNLLALSWTSQPSMKGLLPREVGRSALLGKGDRILTVGVGTNGVPAIDRTAEVYVH